MDRPALPGTPLLAAVAFVAAVVVLAIQLITSSPVVVSVGSDGAETTRIGQYFTYVDVAVVAAAAAAAGSSGTYLLVGGAGPGSRSADATRSSEATADRRGTAGADTVSAPDGGSGGSGGGGGDGDGIPEEPGGAGGSDALVVDHDPEAVRDRLRDNEETVYSVVVDAGGEIPQRDIVEGTDLSKATVSRTLDTLEHRDLLERKRRGMGNVVVLT